MLVDLVRLGRRYIPVSSWNFYGIMSWVINHSAYMQTEDYFNFIVSSLIFDFSRTERRPFEWRLCSSLALYDI